MKRTLLLIILLFSFHAGKAQNIVPDPGFEILDSICPISYFISYSYQWESGNTATPDIFDTCQGIPQNNCGYQYAHAGKGMAGIVTKGPNNYREYLEIKLDSALKDAHDYCVEFWISMGEYSQLATHPPQVYFSDTFISSPTQNVMYFTPQFMDTSMIITDTANWILISGSFNSLCNCEYMLIGNFYDDANTDTLQIQSSYLSAYYYIDDVSVMECNPASVSGSNKESDVKLYPNPVSNLLTVDGVSAYNNVRVYNTIGQQVLSRPMVCEKIELGLFELSSGIYYIQLEGNYNTWTGRFVKE